MAEEKKDIPEESTGIDLDAELEKELSSIDDTNTSSEKKETSDTETAPDKRNRRQRVKKKHLRKRLTIRKRRM